MRGEAPAERGGGLAAPGSGDAGRTQRWVALCWLLAALGWCGLAGRASVPPGCRPPELLISREHPLVILYGPGTGEKTVACWRRLPSDLRPYCALTMDPSALEPNARLEAWRRELSVVQPHAIPIVLQVAGDETEWTTPLWAIERVLEEFSCVKAVQIVEWRCAWYSDFGGDLELAIPANLRYVGEVLKLCARHGKRLSLQFQSDLAHLGCDRLAGPLRELFRTYAAYCLPQNECIPPNYYLAQAAAWGLWLAGYCEHWGMEPQWWWWTQAESYFLKPGLFGTDPKFQTDEDRYAKLYRAFIIEGALMGATVFSIEPPQDIWQGDGTDPRHFDRVIYPTLRQILEQRLIASREDVLERARVAYQMRECATLREYDAMLQDLDLEVAQGRLERAAYGARLPHLMKEMIPDTGGRYYFIPLLPVGTPASVTGRFARTIQPGECTTVAGYRELLDRFCPPTENGGERPGTNRACVLRCGRAIAVLQSRENLFERQPFAVEVPRWVAGLQSRPQAAELELTWEPDPDARAYRVWKRIPGARVYPEWELVQDGLRTNRCTIRDSRTGTFGVTALTSARKLLEGTVNYGDYLLFQADESPIVEQRVVDAAGSRVEAVAWGDPSLPTTQEVWRIFAGVQPGREPEAEAVLDAFRGLLSTFEAADIDALMGFYDPAYRDSNGYSAEYARRAWRWWFQRTAVPYAVAQVRHWDTTQAGEGLIRFTAWNLFRGTTIWDEPFKCHGRVRIPRHEGEQVTWTWKRDGHGPWRVARTEPALPNFGEMLWNSRGHDVPHTMSEFADTPASGGAP